MQAGKFSEAQELLDWLLTAIPLVVVSTRSEANEVKELLGICTEYKIAIHIEATQKALPAEDEKRKVCACVCFLAWARVWARVCVSLVMFVSDCVCVCVFVCVPPRAAGAGVVLDPLQPAARAPVAVPEPRHVPRVQGEELHQRRLIRAQAPGAGSVRGQRRTHDQGVCVCVCERACGCVCERERT